VSEPEQRTRVGAYVVCEQEGALLLSRFTRSNRWTLPGGGLDHAEPPELGAVREAMEETGLRVELGPLLTVHSARWQRGHRDQPVDIHAVHIIYRGTVVGGQLRDEVGGSSDHAAWVPLADVLALEKSALLDHALTALETA
jgi:8-oxo-dGTP diphosphatase